MIAWSWLETHLDSAYAHLFHVEEPLAFCLTANLGTRTKLDTISSTVVMLKSAFPEESLIHITNTINAIRNISGTGRNTLAHGLPFNANYLEPEETWDPLETPRWALIRYSARDKIDAAVYPLDVAYWNARTKELHKLIRDVEILVLDIIEFVAELSRDEIDRICGEIKPRVIAPISRGRPRRLAPRKRASRPPNGLP